MHSLTWTTTPLGPSPIDASATGPDKTETRRTHSTSTRQSPQRRHDLNSNPQSMVQQPRMAGTFNQQCNITMSHSHERVTHVDHQHIDNTSVATLAKPNSQGLECCSLTPPRGISRAPHSCHATREVSPMSRGARASDKVLTRRGEGAANRARALFTVPRDYDVHGVHIAHGATSRNCPTHPER